MQEVPDPRSGGEVRVYECLQGLQSVLAGSGTGTDRPTLT